MLLVRECQLIFLSKVDELYSVLRFVKEPLAGVSFNTFRKNYCGEGEFCNKRLHIVLNKLMSRFTHNHMLMGKKLIDLPTVHEKNVLLEYDPLEREIYNIVHKRSVESAKK